MVMVMERGIHIALQPRLAWFRLN